MQSKLFLVAILFILEKHVASAYREFNVDGVRTVLSMENERISLQCETDMPMAYCGFIHPSGKRFSFSGSTLIDGHCAININATKEDSGEWNCHIGKSSIGVEMKQKILVRVVDKLAAIQGNVSVVHGKPATLSCATTMTLTPLSYCRFEPPNGSPFSITSDVNKTNAILGKYWFPQNKSLDRGDCAVTIRKIKYEDVGLWTCGAGLDDGKEYIDVIHVEVQDPYTMSTASVSGVTVRVIGVIVLLALLGFFVWKKRRVLGSGRVVEAHELRHVRGLYTMSTASVTGVTFGVIGVIVFLALLGFVAWKKRRVLGSGRVVEEHELRQVRARSPRRTPEESPRTVWLSTKQASPKSARQSSPQGSPIKMKRSTPQASPKSQKRSTPQASPKTQKRSTPQASPKTTKRSTPQASPKTARMIPMVVVQSPSEASTSLQDEP